MMKIGMLASSISRDAGGISVAVQMVSRALHHPPIRNVHAFSLADAHTAEDLPDWAPVQVTACPVSLGPRAFGYARRLREAVLGFDADVLHAHGLWMYPSVVGLGWATRRRKPYVISPHGMLDPWALRASRLKKRVAAALYETANLNRADCLHALCNEEAAAVRAAGLKAPICIIPNGVHMPAGTPKRPAWADRVPAGARILLFLSRVHPKKNLPALLQAWADVRRRSPGPAADWHLVIAGWPQLDHDAALRALAADLGIEDRVHLVGPQFGPDKDASYAHADAFVLPSLSEGHPLVILEAWSHGKPVVITPECHYPEVRSFDAGLLTGTSPTALAASLAELFEAAPADLERMGRNGRLLVEDRFTWRQIAARLAEVYDWLAGGGAVPGIVVRP